MNIQFCTGCRQVVYYCETCGRRLHKGSYCIKVRYRVHAHYCAICAPRRSEFKSIVEEPLTDPPRGSLTSHTRR